MTRRQSLAILASSPLVLIKNSPVWAQPAAPEEAPPDLLQVGRLMGHEDAINGVAISPLGDLVATAANDRSIKIWDLESRTAKQTITGYPSRVRHVTFSPDGNRVLSGSWDTTARLWDVADGKEAKLLKGHAWPVLDVAISPDGKRALTCSDGFREWDLETGEILDHNKAHTRTVWSVAYDAEGTHAITGSWDETARYWDLTERKELQKLGGHHDRVMAAQFNPDGKFGFSACTGDNAVRLWDLEAGKELKRFNTREPGIVCLALSADGKRLVAGEGFTNGAGGLDQAYPQVAIYVWDVPSGRLLAKSPTMKGYISGLAITPDGKFMISTGYERSPRIWQMPAV